MKKWPGYRKTFLRMLITATLFAAFIFLAVQLIFFDRDKISCNDASDSCTFRFFKGAAVNNDANVFPALSTSYIYEHIESRHKSKYEEGYFYLQLQKTVNPTLKKLWTSKGWRKQVHLFSTAFQNLMNEGLLKAGDRALCISTKLGQEVLALKEVGVDKAIGIDRLSSPPLVIEGDMHNLPFDDNSFDFEFSSAFGTASFPTIFASEVRRTLKPGGILVLHLAQEPQTANYAADELGKGYPILKYFKGFEVVHMRTVTAFSFDREIVLRKSGVQGNREVGKGKCTSLESKRKILRYAEPLIMEEPLKPWITLRRNVEKFKYLPNLIDISKFQNHVYIDVGARSYRSSIGNWFMKKYPKQNQKFTIYAVEADKSFAPDYSKRKNVRFLPFAAWLKNESLVFGDAENRTVEGEIGMGRIQSRSAVENSGNNMLSSREFQTVQGFDFAEWLSKVVSLDDFVVLKIDIEGTEFDILPRLLETGAICLVDELFLECHYNRRQRTSTVRTSKFSRTYDECFSLFQALRNSGVLVHQWY
ncbi:hypothetical protein KP509_10G036300 [Ceratopteris richardii]|uniref:Methyltransferase type 11 domain-containing protein n=1 Tax=Ceratopteris richardii TaxID=49495 RepID=A0A8T2TUY6_CERRI|nr:hypothetical protein KP509_10G036300 [Ceratopteris richardii]